MSLSVYHYLWMKRRRKRGDAGSDRDERKVWMLPPHPLNYISSKIVLGGSACHTQGPSKLPLLSVHFFHYTSMSSLIDPTPERRRRDAGEAEQPSAARGNGTWQNFATGSTCTKAANRGLPYITGRRHGKIMLEHWKVYYMNEGVYTYQLLVNANS